MPSKEKTILIVEDSKSTNKILTQYFIHKQYHVLSAFTLHEAYDLLSLWEVGYVLLDMHLPDGSGYDLLRAYTHKGLKFFVLTTDTDAQLKEISYQNGVIDFILKDKDFYKKINQIDQNITILEKNKTKTILIVDDSIVVTSQLKDIFENRNYQVFTALTTGNALEILRTKKIDLMILDLELKETNGLVFLNDHTVSIFLHGKIPVLILSGNITPSTVRDALKLGAVDVLKKPYVIEEMILKVDIWINYHRVEKELHNSHKLLDQYKSAIDESTIISKTDTRGIITYVNKKFCEISGYTEEELIGKPHNIVRHPDIAKDLFEFVWYTIKDLKQTWNGVLKNKKKDGSPYWTQSTIVPLFDHNNQIEEYMGIRTDITQEEMIKQYFEKELQISSKNFHQAFQLQKEYEKAIDSSNILSRTDTRGIITYVNEKFCEVSGYTKEELIGRSHNIIRNQEMPKEYFYKLWKTIKSGTNFEGIIKNRAKNGDYFWAATSIVPIKNIDGEIVEYLAIRHDLTELFDLSAEIELTQREIIYKMGEIGESRSKETGNHVKRVAEYSKLLATLYGLDEKEAEILFTASPMHDIGKVGIPDSILKKPGKLSEDEFEIMKTHTEIGYEILKGSNRAVVQAASIVSKEHHEKWDGSGYPQGLKGREIHIYGRITAIADVFDALGSDRCYKKAWELERILELLKNESGKHFDPDLVDLFLSHLDQFLAIRDKFQD